MNQKAALFLAIIFCVNAFFSGCSGEPFRLHIIANSDSKEDQSIKLKVRDEILILVNNEMKKVKTKEQAEEYIRSNLEIIENKAQETLEKSELNYSAKATIGRFEFPDKTYGDKNYPAGQYDALRIVLGDGEGKNWWCVMFPPLCLMELTDDQKKQLNEAGDTEKIEYKSFFAELFESIFKGS